MSAATEFRRTRGRVPKSTEILEVRVTNAEAKLRVISDWIWRKFGDILPDDPNEQIILPVPVQQPWVTLTKLQDLRVAHSEDVNSAKSLYTPRQILEDNVTRNLNSNTTSVEDNQRGSDRVDFDFQSEDSCPPFHPSDSLETKVSIDLLDINYPIEVNEVSTPTSALRAKRRNSRKAHLGLHQSPGEEEDPLRIPIEEDVEQDEFDDLNSSRENSNSLDGDKQETISKIDNANPPHENRRRCTSSKKSFICSECQEEFQFKTTLANHTRKAHPRSRLKHPKLLCCKEPGCGGVTFTASSSLRRHQNTVHNKDPSNTSCDRQICSVCGKSILTSGMANHMKIHSSDRNYKCEKCGKSFKQVQSLRLHESMHSGVKKQCSICGLLVSRNHLKRHMRYIHEKVRPHLCSICGISFKSPASLKYHFGTHGNPNSKRRGLNKDREDFSRRVPIPKVTDGSVRNRNE